MLGDLMVRTHISPTRDEHLLYSTLRIACRLQRLPGRGAADRNNVILGKLEGNNPAGSVKDRWGPDQSLRASFI